MPTIRQRRAAKKVKEAIEQNLNMTGGELLKSTDYGIDAQNTPGRVFKSEGFKEALKELGFSVQAADMTIAKILRTGKEENQIKASQEIYKRLGAYEQPEEKSSTITKFTQIIINIPNGASNKPNAETVPSVASTPES